MNIQGGRKKTIRSECFFLGFFSAFTQYSLFFKNGGRQKHQRRLKKTAFYALRIIEGETILLFFLLGKLGVQM